MTQKVISEEAGGSAQIESDWVRIRRRGIACLTRGTHRLFEDNADTDTWNTSKPLRNVSSEQLISTRMWRITNIIVTKWLQPQKIGPWEKVCQRVSGGLFEASCIESRGPGGGAALALNSCCAHCDKIERGIERNRRHNKPVFHSAEQPSAANWATLDFVEIWSRMQCFSLLYLCYVMISLCNTLLLIWATFCARYVIMDNRAIRITQDSKLIYFSSEQGSTWEVSWKPRV